MAKNRFFTQGLNAPLLASPVPLASASPVFLHTKTLTVFASVFFVGFVRPQWSIVTWRQGGRALLPCCRFTVSANLNRIAEHRFFACCEAFTSLAVGEVAVEVLVVGVAVPWFEADEWRAALAWGPEAPVGEVLGDDGERFAALRLS